MNSLRDEQLEQNILGSMAPGPVPAPLGYFGPVPMVGPVVLPDGTREARARNAFIGIFATYPGGPIGCGANILVAGGIEGIRAIPHRMEVANAKVITQEDKDECAKQASAVS